MIATLKPSKKDPNEISYPLFYWLLFCRFLQNFQESMSGALFFIQSAARRLPLTSIHYIYPRSFSHAEKRKFLLFNLRILVVSHSYSLTILALWSFKSWMLNSHTWSTYLTFLTDVDLLFVVRTCLPTRRISCKFSYRF